MDMMHPYKVLSWNVRGLNSGTKCEDVRQVISNSMADIVCIQETKISVVNDSIMNAVVGRAFAGNYFYLPADGTRGGIILASRSPRLGLTNPHTSANTISTTVEDDLRQTQWTITTVYGPQEDLDKKMFLRELRHLRQQALTKWLVIGDFNLIYQEEDKNNGRVNRRMMMRLRDSNDW